MPEPYDAESADPLGRAVKDLFGLSYLFPYQRLVIANILEAAEAAGIKITWPGGESSPGADPAGASGGPFDDRKSYGRQIVILPTGAGKSLCFQLPAMLMEGPTLVIYPLLGLMADQERRLAERGFSPLVLRGGQSGEEREKIWEKLRKGESRFVIANPEVLLTPQVFGRIKDSGFIHVVIDEAHCVSEWGESFRPAYLETGKIINASAAPLVTAFTATAGDAVLQKIEQHIFGGGGVQRVIGNPDRKNIVYAVRGSILQDMAVRDLLLEKKRPAIVFCSSRPGTEQLARYLRNSLAPLGIAWWKEIRFYHAGLSREEKNETEAWFLHNKNAVLAATCAYGLGIDKADIRTVIHRDCPPSVEAYLQESGRAGRDGLASEAILLRGPDDAQSLQRIHGENGKKRFSKLLDYARDTTRCRREALLNLLDYSGEKDSPGPECCDVCKKEARAGFREEKSVTDFFRRGKGSWTMDEASNLLARAENIRWSGEEARRVIGYLLEKGTLRRRKNPLYKNKIGVSRIWTGK